jgi:hypothetical protein
MDACSQGFGFVANPKSCLLTYIADHLTMHQKVHNLCHNPAMVPPPVLKALSLGYNLLLEKMIDFAHLCKDIRM